MRAQRQEDLPIMPETDVKERRDHPRGNFSLPVQIRVDGSDDVTRYVTRNIGAGGLFIETDDPLPVGTTMSLLIYASCPDGELQAEGTVVRTVPPNDPGGGAPGMAIQFDGETLIDLDLLEQLIDC